MVRVEFLGPIQKDVLELELTNLKDFTPVLQKDEQLAEWLDSSAVAVNDTLVSSLDVVLQDGDKVSLLPPVCGG